MKGYWVWEQKVVYPVAAGNNTCEAALPIAEFLETKKCNVEILRLK